MFCGETPIAESKEDEILRLTTDALFVCQHSKNLRATLKNDIKSHFARTCGNECNELYDYLNLPYLFGVQLRNPNP